jgi:hypothetical protein
MTGYCPMCDNLNADICEGEDICLDCLLVQIRAEPADDL